MWRKKLKNQSFRLSLSLHFLVLGVAAYFIWIRPLILEPAREKQIEIELLTDRTFDTKQAPLKQAPLNQAPPKPPTDAQANRTRASKKLYSPKTPSNIRAAKSQNKPNFPLSALGLNYHLANPRNQPDALPESDLRNKSRPLDLVEESKDLKLFQFLRERIESELSFPSEFVENNMVGTVNADIWFTGRGDFLANETDFHADSPYFKVLVARVLRHAFVEPIPADKLTLHSKFKVSCSFRFEFTEHNDAALIKSQSMVLAHSLNFYRSVQKSKLQWKWGPLSGLGPIAQVNVLWLPNQIGKLFSNKAPIDPLEKYRNDSAW